MDMAMSFVDKDKFEIEEEAERMRASELVKQFKVEMGLASPQAGAAPADKTIGEKQMEKTN